MYPVKSIYTELLQSILLLCLLFSHGYDLDTGRIFVSRDVVFHESIFSFLNPEKPLDDEPVLPIPIDIEYENDEAQISINQNQNSFSDTQQDQNESNNHSTAELPRRSIRIRHPPPQLADFDCSNVSSSLSHSTHPSSVVGNVGFRCCPKPV